MSLWIKICANTSLPDARLAADAGADAVGFVFATSPRQVTIDQVEVITPDLPSSVEKIGVFVDSTFEEISATVKACGLTGVQVHQAGGDDLTLRLRDHFGTTLRILRVLHYEPNFSEQLVSFAADQNADAVLVDSRTKTAVGGTGIRFDWDTAAPIFRGRGVRLVAAGGLNPRNVGEAVEKLHPWGVDVASGVEAAPGRKDPEKVRLFIEYARRAWQSLAQSEFS